MTQYVDGFVLPFPRERLDEYKRIAEAAAEIWVQHGALAYWECVGDDLHIEGTRSFVEMTGAGEGETVIFSWAVFASREARDAANEKIMADPRMGELLDPENPIFDPARLAFGGFQTLICRDGESS